MRVTDVVAPHSSESVLPVSNGFTIHHFRALFTSLLRYACFAQQSSAKRRDIMSWVASVGTSILTVYSLILLFDLMYHCRIYPIQRYILYLLRSSLVEQRDSSRPDMPFILRAFLIDQTKPNRNTFHPDPELTSTRHGVIAPPQLPQLVEQHQQHPHTHPHPKDRQPRIQ